MSPAPGRGGIPGPRAHRVLVSVHIAAAAAVQVVLVFRLLTFSLPAVIGVLEPCACAARSRCERWSRPSSGRTACSEPFQRDRRYRASAQSG